MVPKADVRPLTARMQLCLEDDGATALLYRRIAKYEARHSQPYLQWVTTRDTDPMTPAEVGVMRGAGHGFLLHPGRARRPTR